MCTHDRIRERLHWASGWEVVNVSQCVETTFDCLGKKRDSVVFCSATVHLGCVSMWYARSYGCLLPSVTVSDPFERESLGEGCGQTKDRHNLGGILSVFVLH